MYSESKQFFEHELGLTAATPGPRKLLVLQVMAELIVLTAGRSLQGKEVRSALNAQFARWLEDLDKGFTPINFMFPNIPLPNNRKRDAAQRNMSQFYLDIIQKRREGESEVSIVTERGRMSAEHVQDEHDMISALQGCEYRDGTPLTDRDIAHMMIAILMAGQHTSSATSSWILVHLADRPDTQ